MNEISFLNSQTSAAGSLTLSINPAGIVGRVCKLAAFLFLAQSFTAPVMEAVQQEVPFHCRGIVSADVLIPEQTPSCIYPDSSYQSNQRLSPNYFAAQSKKVVQSMVEKIGEADQDASLDKPFFNRLLEFAGEKRQQIALKQKSEEASQFGVLRTGTTGYVATPLGDDQYRDYQQDVGDLSTYLYKNHKSDLANKGICIRSSSQDITSYFYSKMIDYRNLLKMPISEALKLKAGMQDMYKNINSASEMLDSMGLSKQKKDQYFSSLMLLYANTTLLTEDGKTHPASQWAVMLPKKEMKSKNPNWGSIEDKSLRVYAQESEFTSNSMESVYETFVKCIQSTTNEEFSKHLEKFQALLGPINFYIRGSAAITEWLTQAMCAYKKYSCTCSCSSLEGKCSLDLLSLTSASRDQVIDLFAKQMKIVSLQDTSKQEMGLEVDPEGNSIS